MVMKENVKIFLIALILGMVVAFFLSYKFQDDVAFAINPKVTLFYVGSYNQIDVAEINKKETKEKKKKRGKNPRPPPLTVRPDWAARPAHTPRPYPPRNPL